MEITEIPTLKNNIIIILCIFNQDCLKGKNNYNYNFQNFETLFAIEFYSA